MSDESRAVVVNSLLCFIHNFRHHSNLDELIKQYFSVSMQNEGILLLRDLLADSKRISNGLQCQSSKIGSLLHMFDELVSDTQAPPVFAAADLHVLPMVVLEHQEEFGSEKLLLQEIRQLRFLLQTAQMRNGLNAASTGVYGSSSISSCNSPSKTRLDSSRLHASSQQANDDCLKTPLKSQQQVEEVCDEQKTAASASGNCLTSTPINHHSLQSLMLLASPFSKIPTKKAVNISGKKLDQAVRKLTDRLEARLDNGNCSREGQEDRATPSHSHNTSTSTGSNDAAAIDPNSDDDYYYYSTHDNNPHNTANGAQSEEKLAKNPCSMVLVLTENSASKETKAEETDEEDEEDDISITSPTKQTPVDGRTKRKPKRNPQNISIDSCASVIAPPAPPSSNGLLFNGDGLSEDDELSLPLSEQSSQIAKDELRDTKGSSPSNDGDGTEKPFSCSHVNCHKKFTNKFLLKKHQFIHTGLRPHACPYCNKRFNRKDNLLRHKKTHLANALVQQEGGRKRHNMLYGVSQEDAALDLFSTLKQSMTKKKKKKAGIKSQNDCGENACENQCGIETEELDEDVEMRCL